MVSEWSDSGLTLECGFNHDPRLPSSEGMAGCLAEMARVFNYSYPGVGHDLATKPPPPPLEKESSPGLWTIHTRRYMCMCVCTHLYERGPGPAVTASSWILVEVKSSSPPRRVQSETQGGASKVTCSQVIWDPREVRSLDVVPKRNFLRDKPRKMRRGLFLLPGTTQPGVTWTPRHPPA